MAKILQIIPAPEKMRAHFENHNPDALYDKSGTPVAAFAHVACFALVESPDGEQAVRALVTVHQQDNLEFAADIEGFLFLTDD